MMQLVGRARRRAGSNECWSECHSRPDWCVVYCTCCVLPIHLLSLSTALCCSVRSQCGRWSVNWTRSAVKSTGETGRGLIEAPPLVPFPFPSLPLELCPLSQARSLGKFFQPTFHLVHLALKSWHLVATILILTPRKWRAQYRASPILHGSMPMNINVIIIVVASLHNAWDLNVFICSAGTCLILISLTYHLPTCCYVMCLLSLSSCVFGGHCFQCLGIVLLDRCYVMWYFTSTNDTLFKLKWQISRFTNACFSVTVMLIESSLQTVDAVFLRDRQIPTRRWRLNCTTTDSSVLWLCSGCATHPRPTLTYLACFDPSALVHTMSFTYEAHRVQTCLIVWAVAVLWSLCAPSVIQQQLTVWQWHKEGSAVHIMWQCLLWWLGHVQSLVLYFLHLTRDETHFQLWMGGDVNCKLYCKPINFCVPFYIAVFSEDIFATLKFCVLSTCKNLWYCRW